MPECSYKGTEPSPKGFGFCAHNMKLGDKKKGTDGNMWIVAKVSNGSKRWKKIVVVKPKAKKVKSETKAKKVKPEAKKDEAKREAEDDNILRKDNKIYEKIKEKMKGYKTYFTHDNYDKPYLCYVKDNDVYVYKEDSDYDMEDNYWNKDENKNKWFYIKLVKHYKTKHNFIGCDRGKNKGSSLYRKQSSAIKFSLGNSLLLKIKKNNYVFIGDRIYKFRTSDEILKYYSIIGPNDVPYPVALGKDNVYFMLDKKYVERKDFPKSMKDSEFEDAYYLFYKNDYTKHDFLPIEDDISFFSFSK